MKNIRLILFVIVVFFSGIMEAQGKDSLKTKYKELNQLKIKSPKSDSLSIADSTKSAVKRKVLTPLKVRGYYFEGETGIGTSKNKIYKNDYRFTGNLFSYLPFGFLQDLGSLGQPGEVKIYNQGFGNVSFLNNGITLNNRLLNSFDLNLFQSESIDSMEILPITRGFLYSLNNNSVAVNFITRDKIEDTPYTRLRYYQAADKEGFIDGMLNYHLYPKVKFVFHFTNSSIDSKYANSEYSGWKVSSILKYMASNKLNIIGQYSYLKSTAGLNGGVDLQSIINDNTPGEVDNILYDPFQAPVNYGERFKDSPRYQKTTGHNFRINILANIFKQMPSNLNLYYQFNQVEFRQNEKNDVSKLPFIFHDNITYSGGAKLRQIVHADYFDADFITEYNQTKYDSPLLEQNGTNNTFSAAANVNFNIADKIIPSVFAKYLNYSGNSFEGIGAGLNFIFSDKIKAGLSASGFSKPYSILEEQFLTSGDRKQNITAAQVNVSYNNEYISSTFGYFFHRNNATPLAVIDEYTDTLNIAEIGFYKTENEIKQGLNLNANITYANILISLNSSYYFGNNNSSRIPEFTFIGGAYYVDTLFNSNLKLKTGITAYYTGEQNFFQYDFEKSTAVDLIKPFGQNSIQRFSSLYTKSALQLDYFLAGQIKDAAIVYVVFQNILDTQYYIVPYYPIQSRGIRLGVSWELYD